MKRILTFLLALVLVFTAMPVQAMASKPEPETSVNTGNVTVEGTNGFGTLLSQEIQQSQEDALAENEDYEAGYAVTNLTFDGTTATVEYSSLEEAILIVAVYSEDGMQMLASGDTVVNPDEFATTVTIEGDLPEYFLASAYLMDTYDLSPLCAAYDTPMYTREMQELLASTVADYDEERILNFDDDESTNFAIYADSTIIIEGGNGVNTVASVDDENHVYVIENADGSITGLQTGDVFVYPYGEDEMLIVKVRSLTLSGTTATITGDDNLEMEEVFSYAKIESTGTTSDMIVEEGSGDEGVTYEGMVHSPSGDVSPAAWGDDTEIDLSPIGFKLNKKIGEHASFSGSLSLKLNAQFEYYISLKRQFIRLEFGSDIQIKVEFQYKTEKPVDKATSALKLASFGYMPVAGVFIGFEPEVVVEFEAKATATFTLHTSMGFAYDSEKGAQDLSKKPTTDIDVQFEGVIFFGIDFGPHISIAGGAVAKIKLESLVGLELTGKLTGSQFQDIIISGEQPEERHDCEACLSVDVALKGEFGLSVELLKQDWLTYEAKLEAKRRKLGILYYSLTHNDLGWGECPHKLYRLTVETKAADGTPFVNVNVSVGSETGITQNHGVYVVYLPAGTYTVKAESGDTFRAEDTVKLSGAAKVRLTLTDEEQTGLISGILSEVVSEDVTDLNIVASGTCGDGVVWELYSNGLLRISGNGPMADYGSGDEVPWDSYSSIIASVLIEHGVSSIGDYAFDSCYYMNSVKIPDSVTSIGDYAFHYCHDLSRVKIPDSVTTIGKYAFYDCESLSSVEIPGSVTSIGDYAFGFCTNLTNIYVDNSNPVYSNDSHGVLFDKQKTILIQAPGAVSGSYAIPDSVTTIGHHAFANCYSLSSVEIPNSVTAIDDGAFSYCQSLFSVKIPDSVTTIGKYAFYGCDNLSNVEIGSGLTSIGNHAFGYCGSLAGIYVDENNPYYSSDNDGVLFDQQKTTLIQATMVINGSYVIPDSVTSIGEYAFEDCKSLQSVEIPGSVTAIGQYAFDNCRSLSLIAFTGNASDMGYRAFYDVTARAYYPANNPTWTSEVLQNYGGTITWVPYTLSETGDMVINNAAAFTAAADTDRVPDETEPAVPEIGDSDEDAPTLDAVYGGDYSTEITTGYTLKTASFTGLVPGQQYVLLAMVSIDVDNPLSGDNLLYIDQAPALDDGTLVFQYVQRTPTDISHVVACGASHKDLKDAEITFPEMNADGEIQAVNPTVVYDGEVLTEGKDYTIVGSVSFIEPGSYTCYVRGVRSYTGLVTCVYTVGGEADEASGTCGENLTWTFSGDGVLTISGTGEMWNFDSDVPCPWIA